MVTYMITFNHFYILKSLLVFTCRYQFVFGNSARLTVPGGPTVACSTAKAVEWDASWSKNLDPSGRAALEVHDSASENQKTLVNQTVEFEKIIPLEASPIEVAIQS
ncbi:putative ligase [Medicago truncatula]|uniref:Putative ligase n=1 Tax=Medicago truncatula TaxID=3880 RepID=A0A396HST2_MEDTR|nr:putative ligase [Medicago truncatula]